MDKSDYLKSEIERLKIEHEAGNPKAAYEVSVLCAWSAHPIPDWAVDLVINALEFYSGNKPRVKGEYSPALQSVHWDFDENIYDWIMFARKFEKEGGGLHSVYPGFRRNLEGRLIWFITF